MADQQRPARLPSQKPTTTKTKPEDSRYEPRTSGGAGQTLQGDLAGLLRLAAGAEGPKTKKASGGAAEAFDISEEIVLVAGAGFEPATFRL